MKEIFKVYKQKRVQIFWIGVFWMLAGVVLAFYNWMLIESDYALPTDRYLFMGDFLSNSLAGLFAGWLVTPMIFFILAKKARKYGLLAYIGIVGLYYTVFIVVTFIIVVHFYFSISISASFFSAAVQERVWLEFGSFSLLRTLLYWFVVSGLTAFVLQVAEKFGRGFFLDILLGKYSAPREEARIFMFLDLKSSTTIAESLGHRKYFSFLNDFFADATEAIIETDGQVYQYVGDEIVISWPMQKGVKDSNCLHCFFKIQDRIAGLADKYQKKFGVVPEFKAALHFGPVTSGEVGVMKRDIVFTGDVLNTAARIQAECNRLDATLLVSDGLLAQFQDSATYTATKIGEIDLRGKTEKVAISDVRIAA